MIFGVPGESWSRRCRRGSRWGSRRTSWTIAPASGSSMKQEKLETSDALVKALDKCAADARTALSGTTDEFLMTTWQPAGARTGCDGNATVGDDSGLAQPLVASPRADDRVSPAVGRQGTRRSTDRRPTTRRVPLATLRYATIAMVASRCRPSSRSPLTRTWRRASSRLMPLVNTSQAIS